MYKYLRKIRSRIFTQKDEIISEDQYYEQLFVNNDKWNKSEPNEEELLRWNIIQSYVREFHKDSNLKILDLGCGRGWLTNLLSQFGVIIGIEPVLKVVNHAKRLFPNIDFRSGTSADLLEEYLNYFDLIVSSEVIEHIADLHKSQFVNDINALLKEDGFVIITTPRKDVQEEWSSYLPAEQPIEDWMFESELEKLFTNNGFKSLKINRIPVKPSNNSPFIDIYQVWMFQKI